MMQTLKIKPDVVHCRRPLTKSEAEQILRQAVSVPQVNVIETYIEPTQKEHMVVAEIPTVEGIIQKYFMFSFQKGTITRWRIMNEIHI
jgi:hypothetical protein